MATRPLPTAHLFLPDSDPAVDQCQACGLPDANLRHNARPVVRTRRTRRLEYADTTGTLRHV